MISEAMVHRRVEKGIGGFTGGEGVNPYSSVI